MPSKAYKASKEYRDKKNRDAKNKVFERKDFVESKYKSVHIGDIYNTVIFLLKKGLTKKKEKQAIEEWKSKQHFFSQEYSIASGRHKSFRTDQIKPHKR